MGRAGTGKSRRVFEEIGTQLTVSPLGSPLILLVPEQMTQAADRAFASRLGGTVRAQSLSFRRLAFRVMQEVGGAARLSIDDTGKKMLLFQVARKRRQDFRAFRRLTDGIGWIDAVHEWMSECKRYLVDSNALVELFNSGGEEEGTERQKDGALTPLLRDKLHDLSMLMEEMDRALAGRYVDSEDVMALLAQCIPSSAIVRESKVWIDGFHGFTPSETAVLRQLFKHAAEVTVSLCLPRDVDAADEPDELDLFYPTAKTLIGLKRIAIEEGVAIDDVTVLSDGTPPVRFGHSPSLAFLEAAFIRRESHNIGREEAPKTALSPNGASAITICAAANPRAETEAAARDIVRLVSEGHVRWRDIAVFVRDWEGYGEVIAAVFADFGIPFFLDQKRSVVHHPLSELIRSAFEVVTSRWTYDAVFRAVKTDLLFPVGVFETVAQARFAMDKLENYVLEHGIRGSRWTDGKRWEFRAAASIEDDEPARTASGRTHADEDLLNRWKTRVAEPLRAFEQRFRSAETVRDQAEAVYLLLADTEAASTLDRWREMSERAGEPERAKEHEQIWDRVIDTLDQVVELVGSEPADPEQFAGMIAAGLDSIRMGLVPPTLDQVLVGSLDRTRAFGVKRLFMLGVNDGVIPMRPKENGVISEAERSRLHLAGLELAPDSRRRLLDERFLFYNALFLPSEGLWLSYPIADAEGATLLPSEWIRIIKGLAPGITERIALSEPASGAEDEETINRLSRPERAISELLPQLRRWKRGEEVSGVWWAVYNWLCERPFWQERLRVMLPSLFFSNEEQPLSESTVLELYGPVVRTSVSRLERFAACPFSHFAAYGLRLEERRLYRLEAPDIGQLYHAALSLLAKRLSEEGKTWADLDENECMERAYDAVDELAPRLMSEILFSSNRHRYMTRKLKHVVGSTAAVLRRQAERSGFRQAAAELDFGPDQTVPALRLALANGLVMELSGRIDRMDSVHSEKGLYVRVIDYKSRGQRLNLSNVYYGLSLQLLAYADIIAEHGRAWFGAETTAAGVLYFHVHRPLLSRHNAADAETAAAEMFRSYKMRGLVLSDEEAARFMDTAIEKGISPVVPLEWKTDGSLSKRSSAADRGQWEQLRRFVRHKMIELGTGISNGRIEASPYRSKKETPCVYCAYKPVCGFDPELSGNEYRTLPSLSDEDVWTRIERTTESGGEPS